MWIIPKLLRGRRKLKEVLMSFQSQWKFCCVIRFFFLTFASMWYLGLINLLAEDGRYENGWIGKSSRCFEELVYKSDSDLTCTNDETSSTSWTNEKNANFLQFHGIWNRWSRVFHARWLFLQFKHHVDSFVRFNLSLKLSNCTTEKIQNFYLFIFVMFRCVDFDNFSHQKSFKLFFIFLHRYSKKAQNPQTKRW